MLYFVIILFTVSHINSSKKYNSEQQKQLQVTTQDIKKEEPKNVAYSIISNSLLCLHHIEQFIYMV